jgi:hypothetical protein
MHLHILRGLLATISRRSDARSRTPNLHLHLQLCVRVIITPRSRRSRMPKSIRPIDNRFLTIESCLAWLNRALAVDLTRSSGGLLLFDFFIWNSLWDHINKELEIVEMRDSTCFDVLEMEDEWEGRWCTEISVLDVTSRLPLRLNDVMALFRKVLDEHLLF